MIPILWVGIELSEPVPSTELQKEWPHGLLNVGFLTPQCKVTSVCPGLFPCLDG